MRRSSHASYLVGSYVVGSQTALADARARARLTAELGSDVRYLRTTFLPSDETVLHVFEAASADELRRAAGLAALGHERIVEAVEAGDESKEMP